MSNKVSLSASMRTNLLQLQNVQQTIAQKQQILSTGNKINSALDRPTAFFAAKGLTKISDFVDQAKGLTTAA